MAQGPSGLNFGDDPDHRSDPWVRSPKSAFTGLSKKLPTDFDEILWTAAGVWPRDQLIKCTFWWRSASLSGVRSGSRSGSKLHVQLCIANLHCKKNHSAILLCWRSAEVCALWVLLVCLFVRLFVRLWRSLCAFSKKCESHFHVIWHRRSASVPNFTVNFSEVKVKVKVQGQNRIAENIPLATARPWLV